MTSKQPNRPPVPGIRRGKNEGSVIVGKALCGQIAARFSLPASIFMKSFAWKKQRLHRRN